MNKLLSSGAIVLAMLGSMVVPSVAHADEAPRERILGMQFDGGDPSGIALGIVGRVPSVPWFKLGLAGTMTLAPGVRGTLLADPIKFPIAPVAAFDLGHQFGFKVPSVSNSPTVDFTYYDVMGGLRLGSRDGSGFLLMAGMAHLNGEARGLQAALPQEPGVSVGDPKATAWIPAVKLGFVAM